VGEHAAQNSVRHSCSSWESVPSVSCLAICSRQASRRLPTVALLSTSPGGARLRVQEMFDLHHPAVHALELCQLFAPGGPFGHDRLQARPLLGR
jgi:hypothetical protein